jgi:O-antigen/teichoic acid export membrane protein
MIVENFEKESFYHTLTSFIDAFAGFLGLIIFTRVIGLNGIGLYFTGVAIATILRSGVSGVYSSLKKRGSEGNVRAPYYTLAMSIVILYIFICSLFVFIGFNLFKTGILFIPEYTIPFVLVIGIMLRLSTEAIYLVTNSLYNSAGEIATTGFFDATRGILETILQIILVVLLGGILPLFIGSAIATCFIGLIMFFRSEKAQFTFFSIDTIKDFYYFTFWGSIDSIASEIEPRMIIILISLLISPTAAGLYTITSRTSKISNNIPSSISKSMFIRSSYNSSNEKSSVKQLETALSYAPIISIPLLFGAIAISEQVLALLYTPSATEAKYILIGLAFSRIVESQSIVISSYLYGIDRPKTVAKSTLIQVITGVPLTVLFIHLFGINGIIPAHILTRVSKYIYLYITSQKIEKYSLKIEVLYQILAATLMLLIVLLLKDAIIEPYYGVLVLVTIGSMIYFALLYIMDNKLQRKIQSFNPISK